MTEENCIISEVTKFMSELGVEFWTLSQSGTILKI